MIKSIGMRCAKHVAGIAKQENAYEFLAGKAEGRRPFAIHRQICGK
jgi:hypothetical protein